MGQPSAYSAKPQGHNLSAEIADINSKIVGSEGMRGKSDEQIYTSIRKAATRV